MDLLELCGASFPHSDPVSLLARLTAARAFLLIGILPVACDRKIMKGQPSSLLGKSMVALATIVMLAAAIGMVAFQTQ